MRHLSLAEVLDLHGRLVAEAGGIPGIRDLGALQAAVAEPRTVLARREVHSTLDEKAAALGFSLIRDRPFRSGNQRLAHAAMEAFLMMNGHELRSNPEDARETILGVSAGARSREGLMGWLRERTVKL